MKVEVIEIRPGPYWRVNVECTCGAVRSVATSPNPPPFKIPCWVCEAVLEVDTEGMGPGDLREL